MYEWIIKISAAAVALGAIGYILPKGAVKKASMVALSFLFLTILMIPLSDFASDFISRKTALEIEKDLLLEQTADEGVFKQIMTEYKTRIEEEICKAFDGTQFSCKSVSVSVNENDESETFGEVLSVFCYMSYEEEKSDNTIDKVTVPEINIDWGGISIGSSDGNDENTDMKKYEQQIKETVFAVTGAEYDRINIRWE